MDGVHRLRRPVVAVVVALLVGLAAPPRPAHALNDELYTRQWGLGITGAKAAWDRGLLGTGVEVAVIDTGAHLTHQDLAKNLRPGLNLIDRSKPPQDDWCDGDTCGHGSHVAGIAVASIDDGGAVGVAPRAGLIPVKGFSASGSADSAVLAEGIRWAADHGADVINMSFGPELPIAGTGTDIVEAIRYAWSKGAVCVMSAGNSFIFSSDITDEPVIVVSATTRRDSIADFSNGVGNARWGIAAPGGGDTIQFSSDENIWSTVWNRENRNDTYAEMRGTSQAAPFVAGAAALLRAAGLSPQQTVHRLLATAKDLGASGPDTTYGAGRLDIAKATEGLAPQSSPAPESPPQTSPPVASTPSSAASSATSRPRPASSGAPATTIASALAAAPTTTAAPPSETSTPPPDDDAPVGVGGAPPSNDSTSNDGDVSLGAGALGAVAVLGAAAWALRMLLVRRHTNAQ